ncbi:hypothetical protein AQI88_30735 [Streptomyces cellostaticus]|uniref:Allene oxide cyclase barrel-like domain-containing protein n=2 Tax=Streptomyces cellostaticus TaxID=67285 RepID=A0A101NG08_9ACTN|nr:hypothetical protein AQI88_30735 [Streptomyces cellostaticus]
MAGNTASAHAADHHGRHVHINANFAATVVVDPDSLTCGGFDVTAQGTATGSPIGAKGTWQDQETACTLPLPGHYDINGTAIIGARDGDQISLGYHLTAPLTDGTTVYPSGTFWIKGGTGEYAHASGGGTMNAVVNLLDTAHVSATLDGSIS